MDKQQKNILPQEGTVATQESLPTTPEGIVGRSLDSGGSEVARLVGATTPALAAGYTSSGSGRERKIEESIFWRGGLKRTPPKRAGSLPDLMVGEDSKRKREEEDNERKGDVDLLKEYIQQLVDAVQNLSSTEATATNTRRDVVMCASKLDMLSRRLMDGKAEALIERISEGANLRKTFKKNRLSTAEAGTQTEDTQSAWVVRKKYTKTIVKEDNPLNTETDWDLLVFRKPNDRNMDIRVQKMFKSRFGELQNIRGEVAHMKTATWVMGEVEEPPIARHVFRVDEGSKEETKRRLSLVFDKMARNRRTRLAIAWGDGLKATEFRDQVEKLTAQRDIMVAIHVQPQTKKKPERQTDAIFVKKAEGASYLDVLKNVRDEVISKGSKDRILKEVVEVQLNNANRNRVQFQLFDVDETAMKSKVLEAVAEETETPKEAMEVSNLRPTRNGRYAVTVTISEIKSVEAQRPPKVESRS